MEGAAGIIVRPCPSCTCPRWRGIRFRRRRANFFRVADCFHGQRAEWCPP
jgi:hypothetical protein